MPWGVLAPAFAASLIGASAAARKRERSDADNDVVAWAARTEAAKSPDRWEAYCKELKAARRANLFNSRGIRMSTRLERRRAAIQAKWKARGKVAATILFGVPLVIGALSLAWRAAVWALVS